jgi:hypothetical protein
VFLGQQILNMKKLLPVEKRALLVQSYRVSHHHHHHHQSKSLKSRKLLLAVRSLAVDV